MMTTQFPPPNRKKPTTFPIFLLALALFLLHSIPAVRSHSDSSSSSSVIRLPSEDDAVLDACGELGRPASCPVKCFRTDPVCGVDGVTYWCGCGEARCAGTKVARKGFCQVGNNGAAAQALLLVHIVWLIVLGFSVLFGFF